MTEALAITGTRCRQRSCSGPARASSEHRPSRRIGCDIITATSDVLAKLPLLGKDLAEYSLDTVTMFYRDGHESGFTLEEPTTVPS
jgi:transaldolase